MRRRRKMRTSTFSLRVEKRKKNISTLLPRK